MDLHTTLSVITVGGLAISFIAGITSQVWKSSVEVEGQITKRLTPAGWLSLGISLVGLSGSVASELIRVSISNNAQLQAMAEVAQKKALLEQEARWRHDMSTMLAATKKDIEKNLDDTIKGFQENQNRFNQTQAEIIASKQSLLENSLRRTNEIIVAGQPLASLSFHWEFASSNSALWQAMKMGQSEINENSESSQGGTPLVPFEIQEYTSALLPLLSYVGRIAQRHPPSGDSAENATGTDNKGESIVALIALDDSQNTILSFGKIGPKASWSDDRAGAALSTGFVLDEGRRKGNSTPSSTVKLAPKADAGESNYAIDWDLDPETLADAIDRRNAAIPATAKLPSILKVAIFYDDGSLPFRKNNFAVPYSNVWSNSTYDRKALTPGNDIEKMTLTVEVNGFREREYNYALKTIYKVTLSDHFDDEIETGCTVFEFQEN
jgi:hypothetical protein